MTEFVGLTCCYRSRRSVVYHEVQDYCVVILESLESLVQVKVFVVV